jgi:GntR family transcriptional repressor for pyruvate dehydrogenase complex
MQKLILFAHNSPFGTAGGNGSFLSALYSNRAASGFNNNTKILTRQSMDTLTAYLKMRKWSLTAPHVRPTFKIFSICDDVMFKPVKSKKVYQQVIEQIQQMIMAGDLKPGDRLPSERELTEQLQVSRTSIREALRSLEIIGLLESRHGGGNFIKETLDDTLFQPLSIMFKLHCDNPAAILEIRRMLEVEGAALAAQRITEPQTEHLEKLLEELERSKGINQKSPVDASFHQCIAQVTGNTLLINILQASASLLDEFIAEAWNRILRNPESEELFLQIHRDICRAIAQRNPHEAAAAMRRHFDQVVENLHFPT